MKRLPNLDSLRFIAASLVIIHHIELYKSAFNIDNYSSVPFFAAVGKLGVVLFFVLSGFLITTLLLNEKENNGDISFRKFYMRRILRIWPVYYLVVFLGFFLFPYIPFLEFQKHEHVMSMVTSPVNFVLYLTIFANVAWAVFGNIPYTTQTWSLATEEQFYLMWPAIVNYFNRRLVTVMVLVVVSYNAALLFMWTGYSDFIPYKKYFTRYLYAFNINCMAIGGIFSVLIFRGSLITKYILNRYFFFIVLVTTVCLLLSGKKFKFFYYDIYALLFAIIISNLAFNSRLSTVLENRLTNYLGSISYGLYMFHTVAVVVSIKIAMAFQATWIIYPLTFLLSITVSHLSFRYFETWFLQRKLKYITHGER